MLSINAEIEQRDSVIVASIHAPQISLGEMQELCEELSDRVRCDNITRFVLDLAEVEFLASACLGCMVTFLQDLQHVRGHIALVNCKPNVVFLFNVTRLDTVFPIYEDLDDACEAVITGQAA